jgi:hypothetical protein
MLGFLGDVEGTELCAESGIRVAATLGQAAVAIGEAQKSLDRLLENPNGPWATVDNLSVVACALCTAAGGHEVFCRAARLAPLRVNPRREFFRVAPDEVMSLLCGYSREPV